MNGTVEDKVEQSVIGQLTTRRRRRRSRGGIGARIIEPDN